jgi:GAF domain-containing protein
MDSRDADVFARLANELHEQESFDETVERLVESAPALVGSDFASVLLARRGRHLEAGAATDPIAEKLDQLQIEYAEGPALEAVLDTSTLLVPDLRADGRWPRWSPSAAQLGIASVLVVRLWTSHATWGTLNLYAAQPRHFDANSVGLAEILARHASIAVASARNEESLTQAIDARKLIGQAQGILMERYDLDDRRAFDVLRRYSQDRNIKLNEVARLLVSTRRLPRD